MYRIKFVFLAVISAILPGIVLAQNNTNSPYTRYGYGKLADKAFTTQRGMGGIGYGLRNPELINPMNPASYSAIDSMTFMFDFGVMGQYAWFQDGANKTTKLNGNLEYLALQFPLQKNLGMGVGIEPVSYVGYHYGDTTHLASDGATVSNVFQGWGGTSKVYGTLSYNLFNKLSVGMKVGYLFGDIYHTNTVGFGSEVYNTSWRDTLTTTGLTFDIGLQYKFPLKKYESLTVGAVYTPKTSFTGRVATDTLRYSLTGALISNNPVVFRNMAFEMPESYALGFSYNKLSKMTVGADVLYQKWAAANYYDRTDALNNRIKINAGGEFIPNQMSNRYYNRVRYRAGLNYSNSYLKVMDSSYKEYGISAGVGLPGTLLHDGHRSYINLAIEYSMLRPDVGTLLKEQYFKFTVSYTFSEQWFFKRKVQ
ncbi:membrane protein [Bacteroidia bacterium]|nr:membrane protein [Bacteroidia bacterium]